MDQKTSLFSRARPGKPMEKKARGFLALPGELRNQIYKFYFPEDFRCEVLGEGTDLDPNGLKMIKLSLNTLSARHRWFEWRDRGESRPPLPRFMPRKSTTVRISRRLGRYKHARVNGLRTKWSTSLCALLIVCKRLHRESIAFLYHCTTFVFAAPKRINNFLQVVPGANLSLITRLELHYANYGNGRYRNGEPETYRRGKQLAAWTKSCKAAAKQLLGLRELHVWMYISDYPLWLDLRQEWLTPLMPFRRRSLAKRNNHAETGSVEQNDEMPEGLPEVTVYFDTLWSDPGRFIEPELTAASIELHHLFGKAIGKAILGADEEDAMAEFHEAWEGKYAQWKHYLRFSTTGW